MAKIELTLLGCGTSTGVPLISCNCKVCRSKNPKNKRLRASALFKVNGKSILVDTSSDFRTQALKYKILHLDAILFTHPHSDHVSGLDEIRAYNYIQKSRIPAYGNEWSCTELHARFSYIFNPATKQEGGGIPLVDLHQFDSKNGKFKVAGVSVLPISLLHGSQECIGYRIGNVAYITDCSVIPDASMELLKNLDLLVLDCLRLAPHGTHFNLEQALAIVKKLSPKETILTHLGHDFDYVTWTKKGKLPARVTLAFDGIKRAVKS